MGRGETEVEILQEMRLAGTIVAVDPDAGMTDLAGTDSIQDVIEPVQDLVGKDVFLDLDLDGRSTVVGDGYSGIQRAGNVVLV